MTIVPMNVCRRSREGCKRPEGARSAPESAARRGYEKGAHKKYGAVKASAKRASKQGKR